ncbi:hypothetical protein VULLAG_LOCUS1554 [Vulpes lagopus]
MSANQMATEVLNTEARGEGPISPFRLWNVVERLRIVTSLWEPPISPPSITLQRTILDTGQVPHLQGRPRHRLKGSRLSWGPQITSASGWNIPSPQSPGTDICKHPPSRTCPRKNGKKNDGPDVL